MAKLYLAHVDDGRNDTLHIYSCDTTSDPTTEGNWSAEDTYVFDGPIKSVWMVQQSSDLHIAVAGINERDDFGWVKYVKFDPGTDLFVELNATNNYYDEQADNNNCIYEGQSNYGDKTVCSIAVRSDGDIVISYLDTDTDMNYSRKDAGTWFRGQLVSSADCETVIVCMGASDRSHFFWTDTQADLRHRSLNSTNSLGSATTVIDANVGNIRHPIVGATAFNDGTARVRVVYRDSSTQLTGNYSNDTENWSGTAEADFTDYNVNETNNSVLADLSLDGDDTWVLYRSTADADVWSDVNDGVSGWGTDSKKGTGSCLGVSCGVYDRSGQKLGFIWNNNSSLEFEEVTIGAATVTAQPGVGSITAVGQAPTIVAGVSTSPANTTLSAIGQAPTVFVETIFSPSNATLTITAYTPTANVPSAAPGFTDAELFQQNFKAGPFSVGSALYLVLRDDVSDNEIHVYKCTSDPTTPANWIAQASQGFPGTIKSVQATVQNSDIHIAVAGINTVDLVGYVRYCCFDPGADTFTVVGEVVDFNEDCLYTGESTPGDRTVCGIAVRSDGDVVIAYIDTLNDINYSIRQSAVWTRSITVSVGTYEGIVAVLGASDRVHFFLKDTSDDLFHRSLSSTNVLGSSTNTVDTVISAYRHVFAGAVAFNDGTARIRVVYRDNTGSLTESYSNDQENWSGTTVTNFAGPVGGNYAIATIALDGDDTWVLYSDNTDDDIYSDTNDGISGWGVDNEENDGVNCTGISAGVYDRSGQQLGYVWYDGTTTDLNFTEKNLTVNVTALPGTGSTILAGQVPTIVSSHYASPGITTLTLTGNAPVWASAVYETPNTTTLSISGQIPTVFVETNVTALPGVGSVSISVYTPILASGISETPTAATLTVTTTAPTVKSSPLLQPANTTLTITGYTPSISVSIFALPGVATLTITEQLPTWTTAVPILPGIYTLTLTGHAPTEVLGVGSQPTNTTLTLIGLAPAFFSGVYAQPGIGSLTITEQIPTTVSGAQLQPGIASLSITGQVPTESASVSVTAATATLSITTFAPTSVSTLSITPAIATLTATGLAPIVFGGADSQPATATLITSTFAPTIVAAVQPQPAAATLILAGQLPIINTAAVGDVSVLPDIGLINIVGQTPTAGLGVSSIPATGSINIVGLAPTIVAQNDIVLALSTNIDPSGEPTTYQLIPPDGYDIGDFTAGRIQDDENPTDAVDLGADEYTELEWSIKARSTVPNDTVYEFRVTADGVELDSYAVVPELTVTAIAAVTATPATATLTLAALVPNVVSTISAQPGTAALTITGLVPEFATTTYVIPAAATLSILGYAPTEVASVSLTPDAATLNITGLAPTVTSTPVLIPATATLTLAGYASTLVTDTFVQPANATLVITEYSPLLITAGMVVVQPAAGTITLTGLSSTSVGGVSVTPGSTSLTLVGLAPTISSSINLQPGIATLTVTSYTPTITVGVGSQPGIDTLSITGQLPTIAVAGAITAQPDVGVLSLTTYSPTSSSSSSAQPETATATLTSYAPTVRADSRLQPNEATLTLTGAAPTFVTSITALPGIDTLALSAYTPTFVSTAIETPDAATLTFIGLAPTVALGEGIEVPVGSLALTGLAPSISAAASFQPEVATLNITGQTPAISLGVKVTPAAATLTLTGFAPDALEGIVNQPAAGSLTLTSYAPAVYVTKYTISPERTILVAAEDRVVEIPLEDRIVEIPAVTGIALLAPNRIFEVAAENRIAEVLKLAA